MTAILLPRNNLKGKMPQVSWEGGGRSTNEAAPDIQPLPPQDLRLGRFQTLLDLDLSDNRIEGRLPATLAAATGLRKLNLARNNIVGPLLEGIGDLPNLEYLDVSWNLFSGAIPETYVDRREAGCVVVTKGFAENFISKTK